MHTRFPYAAYAGNATIEPLHHQTEKTLVAQASSFRFPALTLVHGGGRIFCWAQQTLLHRRHKRIRRKPAALCTVCEDDSLHINQLTKPKCTTPATN